MKIVGQQEWSSRKRTIEVGGAEIAYVESGGHEPALLMVHGFTDTSRSFSLIAPHLAGRRLVIPDLRGHGASQLGTSGFSPANFAADVAGLIDKLELDRPIIVGHSLGSMVALEAASRYPGAVGGLVLLAATLRAEIANDNPMTVGVLSLQDPISPADPFYDYWHACEAEVPNDFLEQVAVEASAMSASIWRAIFEELRHADLTASAQTVHARTLIIAGGCDPLFDRKHQRRLCKEISAAVFVEAEHCGHNMHWEAPALVAKAIDTHFKARLG